MSGLGHLKAQPGQPGLSCLAPLPCQGLALGQHSLTSGCACRSLLWCRQRPQKSWMWQGPLAASHSLQSAPGCRHRVQQSSALQQGHLRWVLAACSCLACTASVAVAQTPECLTHPQDTSEAAADSPDRGRRQVQAESAAEACPLENVPPRRTCVRQSSECTRRALPPPGSPGMSAWYTPKIALELQQIQAWYDATASQVGHR